MTATRKPYRVELSDLAREAARRMADAEWTPIAKELSWVAELAGRLPPPPRELLEDAGFGPPFFRLPVGRHVLLYEFDHAAETMRVVALVRGVKQSGNHVDAEASGPAAA